MLRILKNRLKSVQCMLRLFQEKCRVYKRNMSKDLREIAALALRFRVEFFRNQSDIVANLDHTFEQGFGLAVPTLHLSDLRKPTAARDEGTLTGRMFVIQKTID